MGESRGVNRVLVGKPEGKYHLEDAGVYGKVILKWLRTWDMTAWTELMWLRIGTDEGTYECGNELLGSIKCRGLLD